MNAPTTARRHLVARLAMRDYDLLATPQKIELLNALAEILPLKDAEAAKHAAFALSAAAEKQITFCDLLK